MCFVVVVIIINIIIKNEYIYFISFALLHQENKLKEAVATAYTYYITNQDDEMIIGNLRYYRDQDELTEADFVDLERKPYQVTCTIFIYDHKVTEKNIQIFPAFVLILHFRCPWIDLEIV